MVRVDEAGLGLCCFAPALLEVGFFDFEKELDFDCVDGRLVTPFDGTLFGFVGAIGEDDEWQRILSSNFSLKGSEFRSGSSRTISAVRTSAGVVKRQPSLKAAHVNAGTRQLHPSHKHNKPTWPTTSVVIDSSVFPNRNG